MMISVRMRRDLVIVDVDRFLIAARAAYRDLNPDVSEAEAAEAVTDVVDAAFALLDRAGHQLAEVSESAARIWPTPGGPPEVGCGAPLPGDRVTDRSDGLSPAGWVQQVVFTEPQPLQDYGCFLPDDPFAVP